MSQDCKCEKCRNSCQTKPGWFEPFDIERVAQHLKISEQELFDQYLGVDWYEAAISNIFVLAPATANMETGEEYSADPRGKCMFFNNGLCDIHSIKPFECRDSMCTDDGGMIEMRHRRVAAMWESHQAAIEKFLGREPEAEDYSIFEALLW